MPLAYWCVLIAALMPLALAAYAKAGSRRRQPPSARHRGALSDAKRRAYAAHENAFESFPFFAVAVIVALTLGASISTVNILAALFIVLRGMHAALYINDAASARSAVYTVGLLVNIAIFVLPAFK